jgi:hypothetical protein
VDLGSLIKTRLLFMALVLSILATISYSCRAQLRIGATISDFVCKKKLLTLLFLRKTGGLVLNTRYLHQNQTLMSAESRW